MAEKQIIYIAAEHIRPHPENPRQANGFQMMLDLGETEESIAEKTGFSRTTVKHRLNIAKLNQKVLQEKEKDEGFQMSLKDLYELEKIPDVKTRDKILKESTSSNNLAQRARTAYEEIKRKEHEKAYIKLCKAEGIKPAPEGAENEQYGGKWEKVKEFDLEQCDATCLLYKLMVYAASGVADKDIAKWNADYHKENGGLVMQFDEILTLFGFSYSKEEYYKLAEGTHDLFKEVAVNGK